MNCPICNLTNFVTFLDDYKLEIKEDADYFKFAKIYKCKECDFGFVHPMPSEEKLNFFYEKVYRSKGRPPYLVTENYEDQKKHYLEDKNLSYLLYISSLINLKNIKKLYDFGCGDGDLGYALKKKFPQIQLYCTENDSHCKKILEERNFKNLIDLNGINETFDLIITTHSLEHLSDPNYIFSKFNKFLNKNGFIFFEVPNCPNEYWAGRPYDGPHLLFYTKKSFEVLAKKYGFEFINFSYSAYSFSDDHKYQKESQEQYYKSISVFSLNYLKKILKKFIPKKIVSFRQDFQAIKNIRSEKKMNWFVNNTGDNCYIRGIFKKN